MEKNVSSDILVMFYRVHQSLLFILSEKDNARLDMTESFKCKHNQDRLCRRQMPAIVQLMFYWAIKDVPKIYSCGCGIKIKPLETQTSPGLRPGLRSPWPVLCSIVLLLSVTIICMTLHKCDKHYIQSVGSDVGAISGAAPVSGVEPDQLLLNSY